MKGVEPITDPSGVDSLLDLVRYKGPVNRDLEKRVESLLDVPDGFTRWEVQFKQRNEPVRQYWFFDLKGHGFEPNEELVYGALFVTFITRDGERRVEFEAIGTNGDDYEPYENSTGVGDVSQLRLWIDKTIEYAKRSQFRRERSAGTE